MANAFSEADHRWVVKALGGLAQPSRLKVFRQLVVAGNAGLYPTEIADALGLPANTLSFHLKELANCDLVTHVREGRKLRYRANIARMQHLIGFLLDECCHGESCIKVPAARCGGDDACDPACDGAGRIPAGD